MSMKSLGTYESFLHLRKIRKDNFDGIFEIAQNNDLICLNFFHKRLFIPCSSSILEQCYRADLKGIVKTPRVQHHTKAAIGIGLITTDNEEWLKERQKVKGIFSAKHTARLIRTIEGAVRGRIKESNGPQDAKTFFNSITIHVIGSLFFGEINNEDEKLIVASIEQMIQPTWDRIINPFHSFLAPLDQTIRRGRKSLLETIQRCIEKARLDEGENLVKTYYAQGDHVESLGNIITAGYETVSNSLAWMFYELSINKSIEDKVIQEVKDLSDNLSYDELLSLIPFTQSCFNESLRLYPPSWINGRMADRDLELNGYRISRKSDVVILPYLFHHMSKYWNEPELYNPKRNFQTKAHCFIPFGKGPRACIGERVARIEAYLVIISLYKNFNVEVLSSEIKRKFHVTLQPKGLLQLHLTPK